MRCGVRLSDIHRNPKLKLSKHVTNTMYLITSIYRHTHTKFVCVIYEMTSICCTTFLIILLKINICWQHKKIYTIQCFPKLLKAIFVHQNCQKSELYILSLLIEFYTPCFRSLLQKKLYQYTRIIWMELVHIYESSEMKSKFFQSCTHVYAICTKNKNTFNTFEIKMYSNAPEYLMEFVN